MNRVESIKSRIINPEDNEYLELYGSEKEELKTQAVRYSSLFDRFLDFSPARDPFFFSSPGRTEIGGNHTDHNNGRVLAGAVNLDNIAVASVNNSNLIRIESEGYHGFTIDLADLSVKNDEKFTSAALVRGIAARMKELGYKIGGFDAFVDGKVPKGSGLSSSASFEVLMGAIISHLFNSGRLDPVSNALIGQYAENKYFGKPCGLMDQTACACGGLVTIDFEDSSSPEVKRVDFDFLSTGFALVITDTGGSHDNLTHEYAAVYNEMKSVAEALGADILRKVSLENVLEAIPELREKTGDRAILRAVHFHEDNSRVVKQVSALERNDFSSFLELVNESGNSSFMFNQNIYTVSNVHDQGVALALALSGLVLKGAGAWRVHGGGFAGTIQAFVPSSLIDKYISTLEGAFGKGACHVLFIRQRGAVITGF